MIHNISVSIDLGMGVEQSSVCTESLDQSRGENFQSTTTVDEAICPVCHRSTYLGETISCDGCQYWYHFTCVNVRMTDPWVEKENVPYFCPKCIEKPREENNNEQNGDDNEKLLNDEVCKDKSQDFPHEELSMEESEDAEIGLNKSCFENEGMEIYNVCSDNFVNEGHLDEGLELHTELFRNKVKLI